MQQNLDISKLVFIDESSVNCGMTRLYGRSLKSERVVDYVPDVRFERTSIISSIRLNGEQAPFMFKGSLNGEVFATYIREVLAPSLRKDDIVIIDNFSAHKVKGALDPVYMVGATVMFLPPYSPDYNPIEKCWSKIKSIIRKIKPRSFEDLLLIMKKAIDLVSEKDIEGWFESCGYGVYN